MSKVLIDLKDTEGKIIGEVTGTVEKGSLMETLVVVLEKALPLIIERVIDKHKETLNSKKQVSSTIH